MFDMFTSVLGVTITMASSFVTTADPEPKYANVEKDNGGKRYKYEPSGLVMLLIALLVVLLISVILIAFAYHRYRRSRIDQNAISSTVKSYPRTGNGTTATETQTNPSPVKTPTPKKPARSSLKNGQSRICYDNVLLDVSQGNFVSQNDLFTPGSRDDVSWNVPFIDASQECLDKLDEPQPEIRHTSVVDNNVSLTEHNSDSPEREPMLKNNASDDDNVFDDNANCRLQRSPSEQIDLLFRMSLSGENDR